MRKNGWCFGKIARTFNIFILLLLTCSSTNAIPLHQSHNDSSLEQEDTTLLNSIQKLETTTNRVRKNQTVSIKPRLLNSIEWRQLTTSPENLITQVAFDVGSHFTPTYAYITSDSYKKYVDDLEEKCRKAKDNNNIADMRVENLDHEYFRWEENQFNKALLHRLFPETTQGDHSRFLKATNIIHHIRLGTELDNQCQVVEHHDDWSYSVDEKTQFEDYLINRVIPWRIKFKKSRKRLKNRIKGMKSAAIVNSTIHFNDTNHMDSTLLDELLVLQTLLGRHG